jgi:carbon monoxide dehydrogenase subunit G
MRPVFASTPIDAPREQVFDLLCDLSRRPAFTDHFQLDYRLERIDPVGVGASARFRLGRSASSSMDTVIEETERPHLIREHGRGGRANRIAAFTVWELVEEPGPGGCEVSVTFWTEPSAIFDKLHEPFPSPRKLRREWARALRRLRDLVESGEPVQGIAVAGGDRLPTVVA